MPAALKNKDIKETLKTSKQKKKMHCTQDQNRTGNSSFEERMEKRHRGKNSTSRKKQHEHNTCDTKKKQKVATHNVRYTTSEDGK